MIIAGPCLYADKSQKQDIIDLADFLQATKKVDGFRVKLWGGGTTPEKYKYGIGNNGLSTLEEINEIIPAGTEVHDKNHIEVCTGRAFFLWVGARNAQNYTLLREISMFDGVVLIKRGQGMTIDETIGLYDIMKERHNKDVHIVERGINTFDRLHDSRWSPDLKGVIRIKNERPDIFCRLMIDCSHSVGRKEYILDTYSAFSAIGCKHFMFECTIDGISETDQRHMLSASELLDIIA